MAKMWGYVLNIRTAKSKQGGAIGIDLNNALTTKSSDNTAFVKFNRGNSELSFSYSFNYQDFKGSRTKEEANYQLSNNTSYYIERNDLSSRNRTVRNGFN